MADQIFDIAGFVLVLIFLVLLLFLLITGNLFFLKAIGIMLIIPCLGAVWSMIIGGKK